VTILLTGTEASGRTVSLVTRTDRNGFYQFLSLQPGRYSIREVQPRNYVDGPDEIGTQGGKTANDLFHDVPVQSGTAGRENNFFERAVVSKRSFLSSSPRPQ